MNSISNKQKVILFVNFILGFALGALFNISPMMVVIGLILVNVATPALLVIMEAKLQYWLTIGMPALGFVIGYFSTLGNF